MPTTRSGSKTYSHMVINVLIEESASPVVCVEIHVECIHLAISAIVDNDSDASSSIGFSSTIRLDTLEPGRMCCNVIDRSEVDLGAVVGIQGIKIVKRQGSGVAVHDVEIDFWLGVDQLSPNIAWEVCLAGIEPYKRR